MQQPTIDWEEQWRLFAPQFSNGLATIDLKEQGSFVLAPGEGFGDLSHPTTRLTLNLLSSHAKDKYVIDIGCGSGILSIAAHYFRAKKIIGLDIDEKALEHARKNAALNGLQDDLVFLSALPLVLWDASECLVVMNMIFSEQKQAWSGAIVAKQIITSGILKTQREDYLSWTRKWGWNLLEQREEGEWLAFLFNASS